MRNHLRHLLAPIALVFGLAGCGDVDTLGASVAVGAEQSSNSSVEWSTSLDGSPKSLNRYDYLGELHNKGLDAIAASPGFPDQITAVEMYATVTDLIAPESALPFDVANAEGIEIVDAPREKIESLYEAGAISLQVKKGLTHIFDAVEASKDAGEAVTRLLANESVLLKDKSLSKDDRNLLLISSAVAKYSAAYWQAAADDVTNPWHPGALAKKWWNVLADVGGCVGGILLCGGAGPAAVGCGIALGTWCSGLVADL